MFQSYQFKGYRESERSHPDYWLFEYDLTDSEFGETSGAAYGPNIGCVITEYRKRNLNVELNVLAAIIKWYPGTSISDHLKNYDDYNYKHKPPCSDFQKLWQSVDQKKVLKYAVFL